jgi:hypothetical protein
MKKLFFLIFFLPLCAKAQDLIVTAKGDSINCKITDIKPDFIHFTFKYENEIRNTLLPVSEIRTYKKNYYAIAAVPPGKVKSVGGDYYHWRISGHGGWSYMTAKISSDVPADFRNYVKELKSGYHFGADASYFVSPSIGIGIEYSAFKTSNELDNIWTQDTVTHLVRSGVMRDDITIQFAGPALMTRFGGSKKKTQVIMDFAIGWMGYHNNAKLIDKYTITGNTAGLLLGLIVDVKLSDELSLPLAFHMISGSMSEYTISNGVNSTTIKLEQGHYDSISRLDLSIGLTWNK